MISAREKGLFQLLVGFQILVLTTLYWSCFAINFGTREISYDFGKPYVKYWVVVVVALILEGGSRSINLRPVPGRMRRIAASVSRRQWIWILASLTCMLVFSRDLRISRLFLAMFAGLSIFVLFLSNAYLLRWSARMFSKKLRTLRLRTLVLGPRHWCESILPQIRLLQSMVSINGVVHVDDVDVSPEFYSKAIHKEPIDLLILPARHFPDKVVIDILRMGDRLGFRCWLPIEITRKYGRRFDIQKVGNLDVLSPPVEPLENTLNETLKRVFDIGFSLWIFCTILPVLCTVVWLIHRLYSPGPLFFKQDRVGKNGVEFKVYKFRSMHTDHHCETQQATKGDSRIFKGGRFLRKSSIDEIPQFINVLKGQMSVVGPRPHMQQHDHEFSEIFEKYGLRRYVKPGVTGLAQVKGYRGEICKPQDLRNRARLDNFYVTHWDLALDIGIIIMTAFSMIKPPKTAY